MEGLRALGGHDWFSLSAQDLATHLRRTHRLNQGASLTTVTEELMRSHQLPYRVLPMTDQPHPTQLRSGDQVYAFQDWFVAQRAKPPVEEVLFPANGEASDAVINAMASADLIVLTPSNPYLSIDPLISLSNLSEAIGLPLRRRQPDRRRSCGQGAAGSAHRAAAQLRQPRRRRCVW